MPLTIPCSKGCGIPIVVEDETIEEAKRNNAPLIVAHEVCPGEGGVRITYRVRIEVFRQTQNPDHEEVLSEKLTSVGTVVEARSFAEGFDAITNAVSKQWEQVGMMRNIIEG